MVGEVVCRPYAVSPFMAQHVVHLLQGQHVTLHVCWGGAVLNAMRTDLQWEEFVDATNVFAASAAPILTCRLNR